MLGDRLLHSARDQNRIMGVGFRVSLRISRGLAFLTTEGQWSINRTSMQNIIQDKRNRNIGTMRRKRW
jgi:hypothetical protein